jgi:RNA-binding protein YlmH
MTDEEKLLTRRLYELYDRAEQRYINTYSDFLTTYEQALIEQAVPEESYALCGGFDGAERAICCFGEGAAECAPAGWICVAPVMAKFADELTHRDFLGALMNLGIRRETLGDILISDGCGYVFCLDTVADFIIDQLERIKHTTVKAQRVPAPPENALPHPEEREIVVASERLDGLISGVYGLSRSESGRLLAQGKVFVDSRPCENGSAQLPEGSVVSVRGYGRFIYRGSLRETRKGRLRVSVAVY